MQSTSMFLFSLVWLCVIERTIRVWTPVKRDRENGHLFQFTRCVTMLIRFAHLRPSGSMALVVERSLLTLEKTQIRGARHWGGNSSNKAFFLVWEQVLSVEVIEEERKASKRQVSSDRFIEKSRKKSSWIVLEYTRTWVRSIKRRAAPAARSTGRRPSPPPPPSGFENDLRNRRPGSPWKWVRTLMMMMMMTFI